MLRVLFIWILCVYVLSIQADLGIHSFGDGDCCNEIPMTVIKSFGFHVQWGRNVLRIKLNGKEYKQPDEFEQDIGESPGTFLFSDTNSYINYVESSYGDQVDWLKVCSNKGECIEGGGSGSYRTWMRGVRVVAIGGKYLPSGIRRLNVMFARDYRPSKLSDSNVTFILSYTPPTEVMKEYESDRDKRMDGYFKALEAMSRSRYDESIQTDFTVKLAYALNNDVRIKDGKLETLKNSLRKDKGAKSTPVPEGHVGITSVVGELWQGKSGTFWVFPTTPATYTLIKTSDVDKVLGSYDLTNSLSSQMPDLTGYKQNQNGFVYYAEPSTNTTTPIPAP